MYCIGPESLYLSAVFISKGHIECNVIPLSLLIAKTLWHRIDGRNSLILIIGSFSTVIVLLFLKNPARLFWVSTSIFPMIRLAEIKQTRKCPTLVIFRVGGAKTTGYRIFLMFWKFFHIINSYKN